MMLRLNCDSTSPIPAQGADAAGVLNMTPRPSSYEVVKLGKTSHDQTSDWSASEMTPRCTANGTQNAKSYVELVKEITSIEVEILHMESYLLSLYRTAFDPHRHSVETIDTPSLRKVQSRLDDFPGRVSGSDDRKLPPSVAKSSSRRNGHRSLGDHLGAPDSDTLSQDIIRCISSIYCKLGNGNQRCLDSSASSLSSSSTTSTRNLSDSWSPEETTREERGPYAEMIQVLKIGLRDDTFNSAAKMLKHFRTLIKKLEKIDPGKMKREQKLAFWINIHNALVMHAHLAYGTHNNSTANHILKATYNVGGHVINAYTIQSSILGIRSHFRASWIHSLLSPRRKLIASPSQHVYAIEYPEPLVHFALSLGSLSDPAVRIYKAKNVFQDLRAAKEEFIRSTVIHKESKIYVPKILYYFAKDMALTVPGVLKLVNACLPESQQKEIERNVKSKSDKCVCWLSQSFTFRYVIHRDAIEGGFYV